MITDLQNQLSAFTSEDDDEAISIGGAAIDANDNQALAFTSDDDDDISQPLAVDDTMADQASAFTSDDDDDTAPSAVAAQTTPQQPDENDAAMIEEYLQTEDPFYSKEYLQSLDSQKLTDVLFEEDTSLVGKYYPNIIEDEGVIVSRGDIGLAPSADELQEISQGAEATSRVPSWREKSQSAIASAILKSGLTSSNAIAQSMAMDIVGNPSSDSILESFGAADFTPAGAAFALEEAITEINKLNNTEDADAIDYVIPGLVATLSTLEAFPLTKGLVKVGKKALTGKSPEAKTIDDINDEVKSSMFKRSELGKSFKKLTEKKKIEDQTREAFFKERSKTFDAAAARDAAATRNAEKAAEAKRIAEENSDIREDVIRMFETNNEITISKRNKQGKLVVDPAKARKEGEKLIDETGMDVSKIDDPELRQAVLDAQNTIGGFSNPRLLKLVLDDDKLDAVTATIARIKEANPDAFKAVKDKKTIDVLFDESVKGNLYASDELRAILNEYGLSLDDYIMMTVGTATRFGRGLQKFAQLKKAMGGEFAKKGAGQKHGEELAKAADGFGKTRKNIKRFENVVRGFMVSAFATAARNFESAIVRYPMEGLTNLMEEALVRSAKAASIIPVDGTNVVARSVQRAKAGAVGARGFTSAINPFGKEHAFKDSFAMYAYTFGDRAKVNKTAANLMTRKAISGEAGVLEKMRDQVGGVLDVVSTATPGVRKLSSADLSSNQAEFVDYILGQDGFADLSTRFYDQVNEVLKYTGRGEGGISDAIFEPIEDFVQTLNGPNRLQEFVTRRAYFRTDLNMMVKREWGIDIEDAAQRGMMPDILNDAPSVKPEGARSFKEIAAEATDKALEKTYAAAPNFAPFKSALSFLNSIPGSTFVLPFPRFMFKALEFSGEVVAGMPIAMLRKHFPEGTPRRGKANRDAELIGRNIAGIAAMGSIYGMSKAYDWFVDRGEPGDYKKIRVPGTDRVVDTSAQFPLPQLLYITRFSEELLSKGEGNAKAWFEGQGGMREFIKLFTGTNFRNNQMLGNLLDDLASIASDEAKLGAGAGYSKALGEAMGSIATRIMQPYSMVIDFERAVGIRTTEIKEFGKDPTIGEGFVKGFADPFVSGFKSEIQKRMPLDVEAERALPAKQLSTRQETLERLNPELKLTAGLTIMERDTEAEEFLMVDLGFPKYEFDSRTGIPTLDRVVDDSVNNFLPILLRSHKRRYRNAIRRGQSEKLARARARDDIKTEVKKFKRGIQKVSLKAGDSPGYIRALLRVRRLPVERQLRLVEEFEKTGRKLVLSGDLKRATQDLEALFRIHERLNRR